MAKGFAGFLRALMLGLLLAGSGAFAETAERAASAPAQGDVAKPGEAAPAPHVNTAEISARANRDVGADIGATVAGWQAELDRVEAALRSAYLRYSELNGFRDDLQRIRSEMEGFAHRIEPPLAAAKAQLDTLGPPPAAGQGAEAEPVAQTRAELDHYVGLLAGAQTALHAANLRVDQLINSIQDIRRKNFTSNLFQPVLGIYSSQTWTKLPDYAPATAGRVRDVVTEWWTELSDREGVLIATLEAFLVWLALAIGRWYGVRWLRDWRAADAPPFWRRASSAAGVIVLRTLPTAAALAFFYGAMVETQPPPERIDALLRMLAQTAVIIVAIHALAATVLAPAAPHWRLLPASDRAAKRLYALALMLGITYATATLLSALTRIVQAPFALTIAVAFPASLVLAATVAAILLTRLDGERQDGMPSLRWIAALRFPAWLAVAAIVASALAGYLALSRFLAQQLIVTGSILVLIYLLLLWVDGLTQDLGNGAAGGLVERRLGLPQRRREQLALPAGLLLKLAVVVLSVPLILLQWGYNAADIYEWYRQLLFGFHFGNTQISLAVLIASIIVFALGYAAARLFQSWLDARILKPAGISGGVRDSIRTGVGYVGVIIAALAAFSYAGFNLSSLAIVAGAFSVGIGFGLQSVVNNFVSGLILLAERPVKVGDFVVVGGEEGVVRKISVRSTEVETFERARVLIPNSYFITEKVKNWTLRDNIRRITIPVGLGYGCDARKARSILLAAAQSNPDLMAAPAPSVELEEFGPDSLNFKLYAFVADLTKAGAVGTELRLAILEALAKAGIPMAPRQTEVTLRNVAQLSAVLGHAAGTNGGGIRAAAGNGHG